jgi:hypothetical protein
VKRSLLIGGAGQRLHVETEVHDVAILDDVLLAFETHLAVFLRAVLALAGDEVERATWLG